MHRIYGLDDMDENWSLTKNTNTELKRVTDCNDRWQYRGQAFVSGTDIIEAKKGKKIWNLISRWTPDCET